MRQRRWRSMSAWYVFSALGFYSVNPASGVYVIGSPLVDKATIHLDPKYQKGKEFTIVAENNSPKNIYIQSATLNGKPLARSWFTHAELTAGGELRLKMGPQPNPQWGQRPEDRPSAAPLPWKGGQHSWLSSCLTDKNVCPPGFRHGRGRLCHGKYLGEL